jgi:hypothetical protein
MVDFVPRTPWTHEQINEFLPNLKTDLAKQEKANPNIRPLPPMTVEECRDFFFRLMSLASSRAITHDECCIMGQLLSVFQSAVRAEALGHKGRFFVVSEEDVNQMIHKGK